MKIVEQNRKKPKIRRNFIMPILLGAGLILIGFWLGYIISPISLTWTSGSVCSLFQFFGIVVILYSLIPLVDPMSARNQFLKSSEQAVAEVIRRDFVEGPDSYMGRYRYYYLVLEFQVLKPDSEPIRMILKAKVNQNLYNKFQTGDRITVRYAKDDPCIALIEGEF